MQDKYINFKDLSRHETEGKDFRRRCEDRKSHVAIIAPHGGGIEPHTSKIAIALAGENFSLSLFEGIKEQGNRDLHVKSTHFDEPGCEALIKYCDVVISVHGLDDTVPYTDIGGLDDNLRDCVCEQLKLAGFSAKPIKTGGHAAIARQNICNRGHLGKGVQLEITRAQRDSLIGEALARYVGAIRTAIALAVP
jgi:phage replication-related protein YjqB (UPF0714/DUF867 family)